MLDENLPTFFFRPSADNALNTVLDFTHRGSDPAPAFLLRRPDPSAAASKNRYAVAVADPSFADAVYGEVLVEPEWQLPTLSAAEMRSQNNGLAVPPTPLVPDDVTLQLYNPDQQVVVRRRDGGFGRSESWEFEMPERSFRTPSASRLDREASDPPATDLTPKIVFRWKRDGRLNRDMTCYLVGKSVGGRKSKEPDITIALFRQARSDTALTLYEPNMNRVDLEDRKGLEVVLLLSCEAIRDLYVSPKPDIFNTTGAAPPTNAGRRKNSKPTSSSPPPTAADAATVPAAAAAAATATTGAMSNVAPGGRQQQNPQQNAQQIEAETKRLQAMVAEEQRQEREREKKYRAEAERIKKMLEKEEKERRKKQVQIDKETEELRKKYGVQGQTLPSAAANAGPSSSSVPQKQQQQQQQPEARPNMPPRWPQQSAPAQPQKQQQQQQQKPQGSGIPGGWGSWNGGGYTQPPPRPSSADPYSRPQQSSPQFSPPPTQASSPPPGGLPNQQQGHHHHLGLPTHLSAINFGKHQKKVDGIVSALSPYAGPAAATVSGFFHGAKKDDKKDDRKKMQKKRSTHF